MEGLFALIIYWLQHQWNVCTLFSVKIQSISFYESRSSPLQDRQNNHLIPTTHTSNQPFSVALWGVFLDIIHARSVGRIKSFSCKKKGGSGQFTFNLMGNFEHLSPGLFLLRLLLLLCRSGVSTLWSLWGIISGRMEMMHECTDECTKSCTHGEDPFNILSEKFKFQDIF